MPTLKKPTKVVDQHLVDAGPELQEALSHFGIKFKTGNHKMVQVITGELDPPFLAQDLLTQKLDEDYKILETSMKHNLSQAVVL